MKKKLLYLLILLASYSGIALAQSKTISGTVLGADDGNPIPGVTIRETGTNNTTLTDIRGGFKIKAEPGATLKISFIGYITQQITIKSQDNNLAVKLQVENGQLNEVVITAYGNTKKSAFTGTASTITNEKFKDIQATTIADVLQGNAAGVLAIQSTGQPGQTPDIRILGPGSVNASNSPLIVVDGAPFSGDMNSINPSDIQTVTVLKDASSTAIYGSRAANGIIEITTKRGNGKPKVNASDVTGLSKRAVTNYQTVSSQQYDELFWEALKNDATANPALLTQFGAANPQAYATSQLVPREGYNPYNVAQPVGLNGKLVPGAQLMWNDNWIDAISQVGLRNDINLNVSGSDPENTIRYYISGGGLKDEGVVTPSQFNRYTGRAKIDVTPVKWFRIGVSSSLASSNQNYPYQGNSGASNELAFARDIAPIFPIYLRDPTTGSYILDPTGNKIFDYGNNTAVQGAIRTTGSRPYSPGQNPVGTTQINPQTYGRLTASGVAYAEIDFFEGLTFRSQYSVDYNQTDQNLFWNPFFGDGVTSGGLSQRNITLLYSQTFSNTLTYNKTIGIHHFNIVAGTEADKQTTEFTTASATGFTFAAPTQPSYGSTFSGSGTKTFFNLESFFGRANYDLNDKYHLSLALRTDGSTRFSEDDRWGVFYSTGASWNLDKEKFMSNVNFLSSLKLKGSYGTTGNQALPGDFPYLGTYAGGANVAGTSGVTIGTVSNLSLTWEKQKEADLGLEYGIFKDRITGSIDYFDRRSSNLLFAQPLAPSTGINTVSSNSGGIRNYGWEFELNTVNIRNKDFIWRSSFNITKLKNIITAAAPGTTQVVGASLYDWALNRYAGVNPADGNPQWYMNVPNPANPSQTIQAKTENYSQATLYYTGNGNRLNDYTGGVSNFIKYKGFDFSVLASFAIGGKFYDGDYAGLMGGSIGSGNLDQDIYQRWQSPSNPGNGIVPRLTTVTSNVGTSASTRFLYSDTYMRIRNITFGYNLPESMLKKFFISSARLYIDLENAFTFSGGPKGSDPENGINAQTSGSNTTANKTLAFGINIGI